MRVTTLNHLVRSYLSQCRKPIHWYSRFLKYANDGLREQLYDTLQITNTVRLDLNEFFEAEIPSDCIEDGWCKIGVQAGQFVRPLVERETLNRLPNLSPTDGSQINYPSIETTDDWTGLFQWWGININTNGENTGGYYGLGAGSEPDTFKVIPERNVIQVNRQVGVTKIVLEYISDGTYSNAATRVPAIAQRTIETYIDWQYKEHSKSFGAYDAERAKAIFYRECEILRARKDNLTPELVERIINRARKASIH